MEAYRFLNPLIASFPRLANTWIHHDETDMDSYIVPVFLPGCYFLLDAAGNPGAGSIVGRAGPDCRNQPAARQPRVGALKQKTGPAQKTGPVFDPSLVSRFVPPNTH